MELKVWVEGVQRVVCGVTQQNTCHDVVLALAQALGTTGRFSLRESWRGQERVLPHWERPIDTLISRGELAADTVFHLTVVRDGKSRHQKPDRTRPGIRIRKSSSFSGSHAPTVQRIAKPNFDFIQEDSASGSTSPSLISSDMPPNPAFRQTLSPLTSPCGSGSAISSPPMYRHLSNGINSSSEEVAQRRHQLNRSALDEAYSDSSLTHDTSSEREPPRHHHRALTDNQPHHQHQLSHGQTHRAPQTRHHQPPPSSRSGVPSSLPGVPSSLPGVPSSLSGLDERSVRRSGRQPRQGQARKNVGDLSTIVSLQQEKLKAQNAELQRLEQELAVYEERCSRWQQEESDMSSENLRLQSMYSSQLRELDELETQQLEESLSRTNSRNSELEQHISDMRSEMSECESRLQSVQVESSELEFNAADLQRQHSEHKDSEIKILQEMSELQKQINDRLMQSEKQSLELSVVAEELRLVQQRISDGHRTEAELRRQLLQYNLTLFVDTNGPRAHTDPPRAHTPTAHTDQPIDTLDTPASPSDTPSEHTDTVDSPLGHTDIALMSPGTDNNNSTSALVTSAVSRKNQLVSAVRSTADLDGVSQKQSKRRLIGTKPSPLDPAGLYV